MTISKKNAAVAAKNEALLNMLKGMDKDALAALLGAVGGSSTKETKASKPAKEEKAAPKSREDRLADNQQFLGKTVRLTSGKHKGETAGVFFVSTSKWSMRAEYSDGTIDFCAPRDCEIVGDMAKADFDRLVSANKAEQEATIYVDATVVGEGDKAVILSHSGWNRRPFFYKENGERPAQFVKTGAVSKEGLDIFEVLAWKVRKDCGMDSYNALLAKQSELEACLKAMAKK